MDPIQIIVILVILGVVLGLGIFGYTEYVKLKKQLVEEDVENESYIKKAEQDAKLLAESLEAEKAKTLKAQTDLKIATDAAIKEKTDSENLSVEQRADTDLKIKLAQEALNIATERNNLISSNESDVVQKALVMEATGVDLVNAINIVKEKNETDKSVFINEEAVKLATKENISIPLAIDEINRRETTWIIDRDGNR
ncbi:MAG: hypothetical protein AABY22_29460, partial [Nanoarchaeota archaeon]